MVIRSSRANIMTAYTLNQFDTSPAIPKITVNMFPNLPSGRVGILINLN